MDYNRVLIAGRLTRDPQISYLPSQTPVVEFGLAVNRKYKTKDGESREETCFVDCRCYGNQAETLNKYVHRGDPLFIEGRLQFDTWAAKDGTNRYKHRVFVEGFQFLGNSGAGTRRPDTPAAVEGAGPPYFGHDGVSVAPGLGAAPAAVKQDDISF